MSEHTGEDIKGRVKEAVGDLTGNADLKHEGQIDQASAAVKKTVDGAASAVNKMIGTKS